MPTLDLDKLTLQQTAILLCLSTRQVSNLVAKGAVPKHGQGKTAHYVWAEVFDGYLTDRLASLHAPNSELAELELRRAAADIRLKELRADLLASRLK